MSLAAGQDELRIDHPLAALWRRYRAYRVRFIARSAKASSATS